MIQVQSIPSEIRQVLTAAMFSVIFVISGCGGSEEAPVAAAPVAATEVAPVDTVTDQPEPAEPEVEMTVPEMLSAAGSAVAENRLISPIGNNAFHFYLEVLDKEPKNSAAQVAMLELMPLAQGMAEQLIEARSYEEADEAIALLKRAQPSSVVLTTLEQRVVSYKRNDEQRLQVEERNRLAEEARAQAAQTQAAQAAAAPAPAPTPAPPPVRPTPAPTPAPAAPTQVASTQPVPSVGAATSPQNSDFELLQRVNPSYPSRALRQQISGWVELEFTITETGDVRSVSVVNADPKRIFDREATRALEAWKFKPRIENGKPVSTTARQRLEFSLGR